MKTKRFCLYPCCLLLLLLTLAPAAAAQEGRDVAVFVDGLPVPFDVPP
ncbi:MAG TPA: copper amine oxidase, partial [Clostridia bacterium]|nr:copper amine oxidase [Clostridia bacterium]